MKHSFGAGFVRQLKKLPRVVEEKFYKQLAYLITDLRHPSLRAKKFDETQAIWQARVDDHFRFYLKGEVVLYEFTSRALVTRSINRGDRIVPQVHKISTAVTLVV